MLIGVLKEGFLASVLLYLAIMACYLVLTYDTSSLNGSDIVMVEIIKDYINGIY